MTGAEVALGALVLVALGVMVHWFVSLRRHDRRLQGLAVRVHVNGIRGKSTVTRLVAAVLREGGFVTVAKTTGSAARVIGPGGGETAIVRRGPATINEQVDVVKEHVGPEVEALVIECMAVRPIYQQYAEDHLVRSDITIITNVREDHQEEMGESLEEIADAMSATIPRGGVLITAEERPNLRERLGRNATARGSDLVYADPAGVDPAEMSAFDYVQFPENVAIGLAVARIMGIDREAALRGMWKSVPDIGAVRLDRVKVGEKDVLWVPLFAANDRESVLLMFDQLKPLLTPDTTIICILNNRRDRGRRAELFAHIIAEDLATQVDHVLTFGAYEHQVTDQMARLGFPRDRVTNLGDTVQPSLDQILAVIEGVIPGREAILVGMVNIHTAQAELLIEHFDHIGSGRADGLTQSRDPKRLPTGMGRLHRGRTHFPRRRLDPDA